VTKFLLFSDKANLGEGTSPIDFGGIVNPEPSVQKPR